MFALQTIPSPPVAQAEALVNYNSLILDFLGVYSFVASLSSGLTWAYSAGFYGGFTVAAGTLTLTVSTTNYITVKLADGTTNTSTATTHWNDPNYVRVYQVVTGTAGVTTVTDYRAGQNGIFGPGTPSSVPLVVSVAGLAGTITASALNAALGTSVSPLTTKGDLWGFSTVDARLAVGTNGFALVADSTKTLGVGYAQVGYINVPLNSQSTAYTTVLADQGKCIYHPTTDTTARTWTIDSNANVAFPIGTVITFDNDIGAGALTIAITSDTLVLVGTVGSTGSRTLASGGQATAIKVASTRWRISGTGLS